MLPKFVGLLTTLVVTVTGVQVVFDNAADIGQVASVSCPYQEDYADFWVYGCPRDPKEDVFPDKMGFWTGCGTGCSLIYHGGSLPKPAKLWVATYMTGTPASIEVSGKSSPGEGGSTWEFGYIDSNEEVWCYEEIDLSNVPGQDSAVSGRCFGMIFLKILIYLLFIGFFVFWSDFGFNESFVSQEKNIFVRRCMSL